jgi:hypothetical protein
VWAVIHVINIAFPPLTPVGSIIPPALRADGYWHP